MDNFAGFSEEVVSGLAARLDDWFRGDRPGVEAGTVEVEAIERYTSRHVGMSDAQWDDGRGVWYRCYWTADMTHSSKYLRDSTDCMFSMDGNTSRVVDLQVLS